MKQLNMQKIFGNTGSTSYLNKYIFGILEKLAIGSGGEIQLADAINQMANLGKVDFSLLRGRRFDCGSVRGYLEAIKFIAEKQNLI